MYLMWCEINHIIIIIIIDENLKWHSHIAHVVSTISRNLGIMGRAKYLLASRDLMLLYN